MEQTVLTRSMYVGSPATPTYVIRSAAMKPMNEPRAMPVSTLGEYEAGCSLHRECFGHPCRTPGGCLMVPQGLAASKGDASNDYLRAAKAAFSGDTDAYKDILRSINLKKTGHMRRDILGTTISGSARLIIVPQVQFPMGTIALPRNIARIMKVPARIIDKATGMQTDVMGERSVEDGDWSIVVRPPSLTFYSTQPMRIRLWDTPTMGISPDDVGFWHGDFDGDEMHVYPVYEKDSVEECERWSRGGHVPFGKEMAKLEGMGYKDEQGDRALPFIPMTNVPMSHLRDGMPLTEFASGARMKKEHVIATGRRFNADIESNYVSESIRGMSDVARQQLTQGSIGYMSRIAKIVAMCFLRKDDHLIVQASEGQMILVTDVGSSYGCPCLRGISSICSVAQQAALDSHRAGVEKMATYDMISNMLTGGDDTVVVMELTCPLAGRATWKTRKGDVYIGIVEEKAVEDVGTRGVVGAYSPWVLSNVESKFNVCTAGVKLVCNYFSVAMSDDELHDVCNMLIFRCEKSRFPITCARGLKSRGIGWIDHLMATSYMNMNEICGEGTAGEAPATGTCALLTGNFTQLNG